MRRARAAASATILGMTLLPGLLIATGRFQGAPQSHFGLPAPFAPARRDAPAEVAVQFRANDPGVKINEFPAPKLKLTSAPATVIPPATKAAAKSAPAPSEPGQYLDLTLPVTFPVTLEASAARGAHD